MTHLESNDLARLSTRSLSRVFPGGSPEMSGQQRLRPSPTQQRRSTGPRRVVGER
jgi:hypothetical protein